MKWVNHRFQRSWPKVVLAPRTVNVSKMVFFLAILVGVTVASMAWLGLRATQEWRRSAGMLAEQRVDEVATLLAIALTRDMAGAQESILGRVEMDQLLLSPPYEVADVVARAFARFPYPESFFLWRYSPTDSALLFNRSDRPPTWEEKTTRDTGYPVTITRDSSDAYEFASLSRQYASPGSDFALFETEVTGSPYQVVAKLFRHGLASDNVVAVFGFTVNMESIGTAYFAELIGQIDGIGGSPKVNSLSLALAIVDERGFVITQTRPSRSRGPIRERRIPLAFFDLSVVRMVDLEHMRMRQWTARVSTADDALLGVADAGATQTMLLIVIAATASILALLLAIYSLRTNARLVEMKANFVATVSHELKTPLAGISLVGETLSKRRYRSDDDLAEYGALISKEASRLRRLVDNILSASRVSDSPNLYVMSTVDIRELIREALARLQPLIQEMSFEVTSGVSDRICNVRCDREAILQVFENLVENAIKYSDKIRQIEIRAFGSPEQVTVSIEDRGKGIAQEDVPYIFDRFFRGRNAGPHGSGLGLAITRKIITDHGGQIVVDSVPGHGTIVTVKFPAVGDIR